MPIVTCPDCNQEGRVPDSFVGRRIKCSKCGGRFLVTGTASHSSAQEAKAATASGSAGGSPASSASTPTFEGIVVEGIEGGSWGSNDFATPEAPAETVREYQDHQVAASAPDRPAGGMKEYKLLTPKDKVFRNQFDLARLEEVINDYAKKGWTVRSMTTAQVAGFSGGAREELLVLLER